MRKSSAMFPYSRAAMLATDLRKDSILSLMAAGEYSLIQWIVEWSRCRENT